MANDSSALEPMAFDIRHAMQGARAGVVEDPKARSKRDRVARVARARAAASREARPHHDPEAVAESILQVCCPWTQQP